MHLEKFWEWMGWFWKPRAQSDDSARSSEQAQSTKSKASEAKDSEETQIRKSDPAPLVYKSAVSFRAAEQYLDTMGLQPQELIAKGAQETPDKGNLELLRGKEFVTVVTACRFGGVKQRAIQVAIAKGALLVVGKRQNRRISVDSLLKYFPPENSAH